MNKREKAYEIIEQLEEEGYSKEYILDYFINYYSSSDEALDFADDCKDMVERDLL